MMMQSSVFPLTGWVGPHQDVVANSQQAASSHSDSSMSPQTQLLWKMLKTAFSARISVCVKMTAVHSAVAFFFAARCFSGQVLRGLVDSRCSLRREGEDKEGALPGPEESPRLRSREAENPTQPAEQPRVYLLTGDLSNFIHTWDAFRHLAQWVRHGDVGLFSDAQHQSGYLLSTNPQAT